MFNYNVGFKVWADEIQPASNSKEHEVVREQIRDGLRPKRARQNNTAEKFYRCPCCDRDWQPALIGYIKEGPDYYPDHIFFNPDKKVCPKCEVK